MRMRMQRPRVCALLTLRLLLLLLLPLIACMAELRIDAFERRRGGSPHTLLPSASSEVNLWLAAAQRASKARRWGKERGL